MFLNVNLTWFLTVLIEVGLEGLIVYAVFWFIDTLTLPANFKTVIKVIISIIALVFLLRVLGFNIF